MSGKRAALEHPGRRTRQLTNDQVVAWRRRALDQQLPAASFPAGSGAPSLVYLWATMFIAAVAVLGFAIHDSRSVPQAVLDSQRDIVSKLGGSMNVSIRLSVEELDRIIIANRVVPPPPDAELLKRVVGDGTTWTGAAVVENTTRRVLAKSGTTPVPTNLLPPVLPPDAVVPVTTPDGPALIRVMMLDPARSLAVIQPMTMRNLRLNPDARQGVFVITPDGKSSLMQGVSTVPSVHLPAVFQGLAMTTTRESRPITVTEWPDKQLVVSSSPVRDYGITVVSLIEAKVTEGTSTARGFLLALTLMALAIPSFLVMRSSLPRPLRALLRQAKADACGAVTTRRQPLRIAEAYRISRALAVSSGGALKRGGWRPTVAQGLAVAAVIGMIWPIGAVLVAFQVQMPEVPTQIVRDEESRAEAASASLGNALDSGLQTVIRAREAAGMSNAELVTPILRAELDLQPRLRGLYFVDPSGKVVSSVGRESLRTPEPVPGDYGIQMDNNIDRLPLVYAYRLGANGFSVVGEFDPDYLLGMMRNVDGRARVVDAELRTILDSEGYEAFQLLQGDGAREVAIETLPGGTVGRTANPDGSPALLAASGVTAPTSVAHLEWSVVVERNVTALRLPEIIEQRWTLLVAGAVAGIILLTMAWQFFIYVRPLRRLAAAADQISEGSFEMPIPPQRHDDIGAIAMCLEICRQVRHTGSARFGGAIRMRGSEENFTAVLPRVPRQPRTERTARV